MAHSLTKAGLRAGTPEGGRWPSVLEKCQMTSHCQGKEEWLSTFMVSTWGLPSCLVPFPPGLTRWKSMCLQCRRHRRHRFDLGVRKIPWKREWPPTPVFLPGKSHGQRSLVGYSPWGGKELEMTEQLSMHTKSNFTCTNKIRAGGKNHGTREC